MSKKLNLEELKLESFVTSMESETAETVKGGTGWLCVSAATAIVASAIHDEGDEQSWWHCDEMLAEDYTQIVVDMGEGEACLVH